MSALRWAAAAVLLVGASAAAARTADYSRSEEQFRADAAAFDIAAFPAMPAKGSAELVIENPEVLDHRLKILSIGCSAWKVDNPLSQMVRRTLAGWDRDGQLEPTGGRPLIRLKIDRAISTMRCVEVREMKARCITRTGISGQATIEAEGQPPRTESVRVETEQDQSVGICSGLARGTALSGRAASILLVDRLKELVSP